MTNNKIETDLSTLVSVLKEKTEIKLTEAALMLELSEHETETLAKKLADYGIMEMRYSMTGQKMLKIGAKMAEAKETQKVCRKKHPVSLETEKVYNILRHMIAEKRGRTIQKAAIPEMEKDTTDTDNGRQKRLQDIQKGLFAVRENLERIRTNIETDQKDRDESYETQTDEAFIYAK
jgi:esterase/lipase